MVNQKLKAARLQKMWSQSDVAEKVGVSEVTYSRWENGLQKPYLKLLKVLCDTFEMSSGALGFDYLAEQLTKTTEMGEPATQGKSLPEAGNATSLLLLTNAQVTGLLEFLRPGEDTMVHFNAERRAALLEMLGIVSAIALAPLADKSTQIRLSQASESVYIDEHILIEFEQLTFICWKLLRSNDMSSVEFLLPKFFPKVSILAQQPSKYQKQLASIAAHGYNIQSLLSGHRDDLGPRLQHSKTSTQYAQLAGDRNLEVTALIQQAVTYDYQKDHAKSLSLYKKATTHLSEITPLLAARVYAGLAGSLARCGEGEQKALYYLDLAHGVMPDSPQDDPSFLYADVGKFTLPLWGGRTHLELDRPEDAWEAFVQFEKMQDVPLRNRTEFLNHLVETSVAQNDLDKSMTYLEMAVKGAQELHSERRKREAREIYGQMRAVWRHEKRVKNLADIFQP